MKFYKALILLIFTALLFADEIPMENVTIEYGVHDILQKESASSQGKYYTQEYFENVIQYTQEANMLAEQGKVLRAIEKFKIALESDPEYVFALNGLANTYLKINNYKEAENYFKKAIEFGPNYAFPYNNLANLYVSQGKYVKAKNLLQQALKEDPNSARINYNLANIYLREKKLNIAVTHYKKAIKFDPEFCNARYNLAITYWKLKLEKQAIEEYEKLVNRCPGHSKGVLNLAAFYIDSKEVEKALMLYKQALILNPDPEIYIALGHAYHNQGYYVKEIDAYRNAVTKDSTNIKALYYLALSYKEQKMYISSREAIDRILKIDPEHEKTQLLLKFLDLDEQNAQLDEQNEEIKKLEEKLEKTYEEYEALIKENSKK